MVYQLAKTSTLLSGQVKWDMVLDGNKVTNLQFVPISEHIPFNYYSPVDVMNYSHCDNIKSLYSKISDKFYTPVVNPKLSDKHLYRSKNLYQDTHENTYEMGMKRVEYHRYSKQFSFFCPIWCDNVIEFNNLRFKICVKNSKNPDRILYSSFIDMDYIKEYMKKYFDTLEVYPIDERASLICNGGYYKEGTTVQNAKKEYVNILDQNDKIYVDDNLFAWKFTLEDIADPSKNTYSYYGKCVSVNHKMSDNTDLIYLNFTEKTAWAKGINAEKGIVQVADTSSIINNLVSKERPMLEFDNMIANIFPNNKLICTQLFNFNFLFNLDDFIPQEFIANMIGEKMNIYVDVYCGSEKVEVRDFYSNYAFIPRYDTYKTQYLTDKNALDYLRDYDIVDFITKNKIVQSTFHWCYQSNQDIMFNMYDGTSPLFNGMDKIQGIHNTFSDLFTQEFDCNKNPFGFLSYHNLDENSTLNFFDDVENILSNESNYYEFDFKDEEEYQWFGDMMVMNKKVNRISSCDKIKTIIIKKTKFPENQIIRVMLSKSYTQMRLTVKNNITLQNFLVFYKIDSDTKTCRVIFFVTENEDSPTFPQDTKNVLFFNGFLSSEFQITDNEQKEIIESIQNILYNVKMPLIFMFDDSIVPEHYNSPDIDSNEATYVKAKHTTYIQRYDLNIYPMMIRTDDEFKFNYTYWCKQFVNTIGNDSEDIDNIKRFNNISFKKFSPLYPSIGYFVLNDCKTDYENFYMSEYIKEKTDNKICYQGDTSWYKNNSMFVLPSSIELTYTGKQLTDDIIFNMLFNYFIKNLDVENLSYTNEEKIKEMYSVFSEKIFDLYTVKYKFDYLSDKDINNYNYEIKYTLR